MTAPKLPPEYQEFVDAKGGPGLSSMDDRMDFMIILLDQILKQLGGTVVGAPEWARQLTLEVKQVEGVIARLTEILGYDPESVLRNPPFIRSQVKLVAAAGTAVRLPDIKVPNGFFVVIKALRSNWDTVYIGPSKSDAEGHTTAYGLAPGEPIELRISTLENLWLDAIRSGEGITWIVEQEATY